MENNHNGELRINGAGNAPGGCFSSVRINGSGKIDGDVQCKVFRINGSGLLAGNLETEDGEINGSGTIDGDLKAEQFKIKGSGRIRGSVKGDSLSISGSAVIDGGIDVQDFRIEGSPKIGQNCSAEVFIVDGSFEINGLLNADDIKVKLYFSKSKAKEIGGGKIKVTLGPVLSTIKSILSIGFINPTLEVESIEGDEIELENTSAKIIRGNNVTIGRGCDIGIVEYKEKLTVSGDAKVAAERKIS